MTTRYYATLLHHSISRCREVDVGDNLTAAKRAASREFGDGYLDHTIAIYDRECPPELIECAIARRRISETKWTTL